VSKKMTCTECPYFDMHNVGIFGLTGRCQAIISYANQLEKTGLNGRIGATVIKFFASFISSDLVHNCKYYKLASGADN
jgi:hypothetical protein